MSDVEGAAPAPSRLPVWFLVALPLLALVFFGLGLHRANRTTLRGDEIVSLMDYAHERSLKDMILKGVAPQVSPAPLLYLADKGVYEMKASVGYFGLTPPGYYRLPSLLLVTLLGSAAALALAVHLRTQGGTTIQYFLVLAGLAAFFFHPKAFAFAGTERPHAFWNALWLFLLAWLLVRPPAPRVPLAILCLMAATATASCFQILAVGIALVIVRRIEGRPLKEILKEGALLLAAPAAIGVYYALKSVPAAYEEREIGEVAPHFFKFWLWTNLHVWIAGAGMVALVIARPKLRAHAIPPVALAALLLLVPLTFALSHSRGFSLVSRQYLWTTTAVPLALFFAAVGWPELRPTPLLRGLAVAASAAIVAGSAWVSIAKPPRNDSRELRLLEKDSPLMLRLKTNRPALLCPSSMEAIEQRNLQLIYEWMKLRYPGLPGGRSHVLIRIQNGRLEAGPFEPKPEDAGSYTAFGAYD